MPADPPPARPRDRFGRPLRWGAETETPFEDYAARSLAANEARGLEHFRAGRYFAAHEAWEEAWRQAKGSDREAVLKGLAQLGAGYVHVQRRNAHGARALLRRTLAALSTATEPPWVRTLVAMIERQATEAEAALAELRAPRLIPPVAEPRAAGDRRRPRNAPEIAER